MSELIYVEMPDGEKGLLLLTRKSFAEAKRLSRAVSVLMDNAEVRIYMASGLKEIPEPKP